MNKYVLFNKDKIGLKIKELRKQKGMTQKELAEKTGLAEITIRKIESGIPDSRASTIKKISTALETDVIQSIWDDIEPDTFNTGAKFVTDIVKNKMNDLMDQLNEKGQEKAIDQVEMLTKIDEYKK